MSSINVNIHNFINLILERHVLCLLLVSICFCSSNHFIKAAAAATKCSATSTKPLFDLDRLDKISTPDFRNMFSFAGYVRFDENNKLYSPVGLSPMKSTLLSDSKIVLSNDCSNVTFNVFNHQVQQLNFDFLIDGGKTKKSCFIENFYSIPDSLAPRVKYSCKEFRQYECVGTNRDKKTKEYPVYLLALETLIMEFDGDKAKIRDGKFSKTDYFCFK